MENAGPFLVAFLAIILCWLVGILTGEGRVNRDRFDHY